MASPPVCPVGFPPCENLHIFMLIQKVLCIWRRGFPEYDEVGCLISEVVSWPLRLLRWTVDTASLKPEGSGCLAFPSGDTVGPSPVTPGRGGPDRSRRGTVRLPRSQWQLSCSLGCSEPSRRAGYVSSAAPARECGAGGLPLWGGDSAGCEVRGGERRAEGERSSGV